MRASAVKNAVLPTLLLILTVQGFIIPSFGQTSSDHSEMIYTAIFTADEALTKYTLIVFEGINSLPIDTYSAPFSDHFKKATFEIMPWGVDEQTSLPKFGIRVVGYYEPDFDNNTATMYTEQICDKFLTLFQKSNLEQISIVRTTDRNTNDTKVIDDYGFFQLNLTSIQEFLTYKPTEGFGILVNQDFLSRLLSIDPNTGLGDSNAGLTDLTYPVKRADSGFDWGFSIGYSTSTVLKPGYEEISLNDLLCNSQPIELSSQKNSTIRMEMETNLTVHDRIYHLTLDDLSPPYDSRDTRVSPIYDSPNSVSVIIIKYNSTRTINDVRMRVKVTIETVGDGITELETIGVGVLIALAVLGISFVVVRKYKKRNKIG